MTCAGCEMPKLGARDDDELAMRARRKEAARLYLEGVSQTEIAERLDVSQPTIARDLEVIRKAWEASAILDWDAAKSRELMLLDNQYEQLYKAWLRSCEVEQVRTRDVKKELRADRVEGEEKENGKKQPKIIKQSMVPVSRSSKVVEKQLIGDVRYMDAMTRIIELRCKIFGFLKDEKPQQTNNQNNFFVLLEEAVKITPDPGAVALEEQRAKIKQLESNGTHDASTISKSEESVRTG